MDAVVTSAGMQAVDRRAVTRFGIPSALLMENAGRRVAEEARIMLEDPGAGPVAIVCGRGNNGGDGFVAARHLVASGARVHVALIGRPSHLEGDPRMNFNVLRKMREDPAFRGTLSILVDPGGRRLGDIPSPSVVIDALFGTGFRGKLGGGAMKAVQWMNGLKAPTISVDIPSGLDADNGSVGNSCVLADLTVTMGLIKAGLLVGRGPEVRGRLVVADLGIPVREVREKGSRPVRLICRDDAAAALPRRRFDAHKHSVGKILVVAGSVGYTGAAALASGAAMRGGAGAVILATPRAVYPVLARKLTEVMVKPVTDTAGGALCEASLDEIGREVDWADVIVVGPGIGMSADTGKFMKNLLKTSGKRFLIDADGLNHLSGNNALKGRLRGNTCILTPHSGEFSRLTGLNARELEGGRIRTAVEFAKKHGITLVLKGSPSITVAMTGEVFINPTGNRGMATAGMGDVLSGLLGAIWGESGDPVSSAYAAVYYHGLAGDTVAERIGYRAMMAGDVLKEIPEVLHI